MADVTISVRLFGAFRRFGDHVSFSVPAGAGVDAVKGALAVALGDVDLQLIAESVLADDTAVLAQDATFTKDCSLAILPPVCGG